MTTWSEREAQLLQAVATGDLPADAPAIRDAAARSPAFAAAVAEEVELLAQLSRAAATQDEMMAAAGRLPEIPGTAQVLQHVRERIGAPPPPARPSFLPGRRRAWPLVAALVLVGAAMWWLRHVQPTDDQTLSGPAVQLRAPQPLPDAGLRLAWEYPLRAGESVRVVLLAAGDERVLREVTAHDPGELVLSTAELAALPAAFRWRVVVKDASGRIVTQATGQVRK